MIITLINDLSISVELISVTEIMQCVLIIVQNSWNNFSVSIRDHKMEMSAVDFLLETGEIISSLLADLFE